MQKASRPSSPTLSSPKSATTLWTARLIATLWKLAVKRARLLRRQSPNHSDIMYGSALSQTSGKETLNLDEALIMHEAALSVVASGVVSLADLEAVTGYCLSKTHGGEMSTMKDDDANSEAATDMSDSCSIADSEMSERILDEEIAVVSPVKKSTRASSSSTKPVKWVCVGYGRYEKVQE